MLHNTKGIVLRVTKYGDTSIILTAYTELFGVQQYIVKGVRVTSKKGANKGVFYQPAAILQMEVYHSPMKQLQMVKEVSWDFVYQNVYSDVLRNAVATYIVEVLQQTMQPEPHPELFYLIEDTFKQLDKGGPQLVGNLPIYFLIHLSQTMGFGLQGKYSVSTPVLDVREGQFVEKVPAHPYFLEGLEAQTASSFLQVQFYNDLDTIVLNGTQRKKILELFQLSLSWHYKKFSEIKSLPILQEVLK
ncbi:MAG: DNA repair protein RecO [Chitinophagia bacterium]|jgi:DNA repair protein RecO (recombination protein O)|nr:DNA repair protein RecO [Chitinophagia bacterium]NCA30151.1 DNA repair protein RecO [Chitinophagia bacterium]